MTFPYNNLINDIPMNIIEIDDGGGSECSVVQQRSSTADEMDDVSSSSLLNKLGNHHYERGNYDDALIAYKQGLEKMKLEAALHDNPAKNSDNITAIIDLLTKMGEIYKILGEYQEALHMHKEVFEIKRNRLGGTYSHPDLCSTLSHVASIHYETRQYEKSLKTYQQVLQIQRYNELSSCQEHLFDISSTLVSIGLVFFQMEYHQYALHTFEESLRIRKQLLLDGNIDTSHSKSSNSATEQKHPSIAIILYNIGMVYLEIGDDNTALLYYKETLREEIATLGKNHEDIAVTFEHIGYVYQQRGEIDKAIKYFVNALEIYKTNPNKNSLSSSKHDLLIAQTLNNIGNLYLQKGQIEDMVTCLSDAMRYLYKSGKSDDDLSICGFCYYALSKIHPECASAA